MDDVEKTEGPAQVDPAELAAKASAHREDARLDAEDDEIAAKLKSIDPNWRTEILGGVEHPCPTPQGTCPKCDAPWNGDKNEHDHAFCCGCDLCGYSTAILPFPGSFRTVTEDPEVKITKAVIRLVAASAVRCPSCRQAPSIAYGMDPWGNRDPVYRLECNCVDGTVAYGDTVRYVIAVWNDCISSPHQKGVFPSKPTAIAAEYGKTWFYNLDYVHRLEAELKASETKHLTAAEIGLNLDRLSRYEERENRIERLLREILHRHTCPPHYSSGRQDSPCDCVEKITLHPAGAFIAKETWCPKHGYDNDCYLCHPNAISTELCIKHGTPGGKS